MEALTDSGVTQANTITEKEEMLRRESLPLTKHNQYLEQPPAGQAHQSVTEQAVRRALFAHSIRKGRGPDKLTFEAIRLIWELVKKPIMDHRRAVIRTCRRPAVWKRASGVVHGKPGKDDSRNLQAYRSIILLSCMGKVVKEVVAELLPDEAERRGLLSDGQYESRKSRSAIDVAAIKVDSAHAAWRDGHIGGVLPLDIKAAFLSVEGETDPHYERQGDGWRPHTMDGMLCHRLYSRNGNRGQCYGETPGGCRSAAGLTGASDPLCN